MQNHRYIDRKRVENSYAVAAVQFDPVMFEKEQNVQQLLHLAEIAAVEGNAKLIVMPEMASTGYCWYNREEIETFVEEIPGPTTELFEQFAERHNCFIVFGLPEIEPTTRSFYNSIVFVGPTGFLGKYRKTHLFVADSRWAREGDCGFPLFNTEIGVISGLICQDLMYFEPARILALQGADVICCPSNWLRSTQPSPFWPVRAFENGVFIVCANRAGSEREVTFHGNSCVISPDGRVQDTLSAGEGIIYGQIDLAESSQKSFDIDEGGNRLLDRRPEAYHILSLNPYRHDPVRLFGLNKYRPLPKGQRSLIASASFPTISETLNESLEQFERVITQAVEAAPLPLLMVTLPPISFGGDVREREDRAQTIPGPFVDLLTALSKHFNLFLVCGLIEQDGTDYYKATILVGPEGYIGKYRQIHLSETETKWLKRGSDFPTFDIPIGRIGLLSGFDLLFPESTRCLALSGVDLVAVSFPLQCAGRLEELRVKGGVGINGVHDLWRTRAGENCLYLCIADQNKMATEINFDSTSSIVGPNVWRILHNGTIELKTNELIRLALMDTTGSDPYSLGSVVRRKDLLSQRETRWYDALLKSVSQPSEQKVQFGSSCANST